MDKQKRRAGRLSGGILLSAVLGVFGFALIHGGEKAASKELPSPAGAAFDLKEISVFDVPDSLRTGFTTGHSTPCRTGPDNHVGRYPEFRSSRPLYGCLQVAVPYGRREPGLSYQYAIDESDGTGQGYDRLYLDTNLNGDLTDDGSVSLRRNVPRAALSLPTSAKMSVYFDCIRIRVDPNDDSRHRLEVMPRLRIYKDPAVPPYLSFITTTARKGQIEIGGKRLQVFLGHSGGIAGWFDHPATTLRILPAGRAQSLSSWVGGQQLSTTYRRDDTFYRFSATPDGDKLFVRTCESPLGTLEIQAGGRKIADATAAGSLQSRDTAVLISDELDSGGADRVHSSRLLIGNYHVGFLNVSYGELQFGVLRNSHLDGRPQARVADLPEEGVISIRADKPFVLDFSGKPEVLFALPARDCHVRVGEELSVKAVLVDPSLDIMFRYIRQGRQQLDPRVVITRAGGEIVAEGVMPFG